MNESENKDSDRSSDASSGRATVLEKASAEGLRKHPKQKGVDADSERRQHQPNTATASTHRGTAAVLPEQK